VPNIAGFPAIFLANERVPYSRARAGLGGCRRTRSTWRRRRMGCRSMQRQPCFAGGL
jgi:hypothetical protein